MYRPLQTLLVIALGLAPAGLAGSAPLREAFSADAPVSRSDLLHQVNIIDGADERDSLLTLGPQLGLSSEEIARIRKVTGYVGCFRPSPSVGTGALFLTNGQILTAGHIFFDPSGAPRSKCFFKNQDSVPIMIDLAPERGIFGATPPRAGSNDDYAIVPLVEPLPGGEPFPVAEGAAVAAGDRLIVASAHPAGLEREVDEAVPVVQGCSVRRAPISSGPTSFFRTDCDATGSSSGGAHLSRVGGELIFRGITITTGPWRDEKFRGAPYDERGGSVTTALGTDAAILRAGRELAGRE